jgi:hypothetical protein
MTLVFGCNAGVWDAVNKEVPGTVGCRSYRDTVNQIPAAWPGKPGSSTIVSLRPLPDDLLAGRLDDQIKALLAVAPAKAELTVWHEAGMLHYPEYITPAAVRQMHVRMHRLCAPTPVRYGCIIAGFPATMQDWIPKPGHPMDWYGIDVYMTPHMTKPDGTVYRERLDHALDSMLAIARARSGKRWPHISVPETNSPHPSRRPEWFTAVAGWLARNGGQRMMSFWKEDGPLSGPWLPDDTATIRTLSTLVKRYG